MYELKDLKNPLMEFMDSSEIISREFSEKLNNNPDYASSMIFAGIFCEYRRIYTGFHSRSFAHYSTEVHDEEKKELIMREFADFLHQTPYNAVALQKELMKHPEVTEIYLTTNDGSTLSKEEIAESMREHFAAIIDIVECVAQPTLEYIEKYRQAVKESYFEILAKRWD